MAAVASAAGSNLLLIRNFFDAATCEKVLAEMRSSGGAAATVYRGSNSGSVDQRARRATRLSVSHDTAEMVKRLLLERKRAVEEHFRVELSDCEEPQFLRYDVGDFFVAHQDGNTPLIHDASRFRKVSAVLFLSAFSEDPAPESYGGGALVLHGPYSGPPLSVPLTPEPGTLICFRAETTHEVLPVTHGERFTLVSWYL